VVIAGTVSILKISTFPAKIFCSAWFLVWRIVKKQLSWTTLQLKHLTLQDKSSVLEKLLELVLKIHWIWRKPPLPRLPPLRKIFAEDRKKISCFFQCFKFVYFGWYCESSLGHYNVLSLRYIITNVETESRILIAVCNNMKATNATSMYICIHIFNPKTFLRIVNVFPFLETNVESQFCHEFLLIVFSIWWQPFPTSDLHVHSSTFSEN